MGKLYMYCLVDEEVAAAGLNEMSRIRGTSDHTITGCICNRKRIYCPNLHATQERGFVPEAPVETQMNPVAAVVDPRMEIVEEQVANDVNNIFEQQENVAPSFDNGLEQYLYARPNIQVLSQEQQGAPQPEPWNDHLADTGIENEGIQYRDHNLDQERKYTIGSSHSSSTESAMHIPMEEVEDPSGQSGLTVPYEHENNQVYADDQPGPSPPIERTAYPEMPEGHMRYGQSFASTLDQYESHFYSTRNDELSMGVLTEGATISHHQPNSPAPFEQDSRSGLWSSGASSPIEEASTHMLETTYAEETPVDDVLRCNNPSDQQEVRRSGRVSKRRLNEIELNPAPKRGKKSLIGTSSAGNAKQDVRRKVGRPRKGEAKKNVGRPLENQPKHRVARQCTIGIQRAVGRARKIRVKRAVGRPAKNQQTQLVGKPCIIKVNRPVGRPRKIQVKRGVGRPAKNQQQQLVDRPGTIQMNGVVGRPRQIEPKRRVGRPTKKSQNRSVRRPRKIQVEEKLDQPSENPQKRPITRPRKNRTSNSSSRNAEQKAQK